MALERVRKNDVVMVRSGKERGKTGKILRVLKARGRVLVEGVNLVKRHRKARGQEPGGIIEREASVHVSNVMPLCRQCDKPARVGRRKLESGEAVRICRRCGQQFEG